MNIRRLSSDTLCLTCEDDIAEGELAHTEPRVGSWHLDCSAPRNLHIYQRERDRAARRHKRLDSAQYDV